LVTIVADKVTTAPKLPVPFLESEDVYAVMASASTTDEAYQLACDLMMGFLTDVVGLRVNDAGMLMSLIGNLKFCQVVDPQVTVRFEIPKEPLARLGFEGL
jgi:amidase